MSSTVLWRAVFVLVFIFGANVSMAGVFGKSSIGSPWKELFSDVSKLNAHFKLGHKAVIHDVVIENFDLSRARFDGALFENTDWRKVVARNSFFKNSTFRKCKLTSIDLENSTFENVTFENCELVDVSFFQAKMSGVKFIDCKLIDETTFQKSSSGELFFDRVKMNKVAFFQAQAKITIKNSELDNIKMNAMIAPSSLIFEKSNLIEVNIDRSALSLFRAVDSKVDATFENAKIDVVEFSNDEIDAGLDDSTLGTLTVHNSTISTLRMNTAHIDKVIITKCTHTRNLGFFESTIREMEIAQSSLNELDLADVSLDLLTTRDTLLFNSDLKRLRAKNLVLENVSLDKKIDFTGAQIGSIKAKNVSKLPSLHLITTGSNVQLD